MAYKLIKEEYCPCADAQQKEFLCDTDADFATLPKCCPGSTALSVASKNVYMVNASGRWVLFGGGSDGAPLEGDGAEYYTLAPTALSFRSTAPLDEFQEVQVNGDTVDPANYTLEEGSTIVKFSIDYLKTLNTGNYEVAVVSKNTTVKGNFAVKAPELNEYGFYYNQPYTAKVDSFGGTAVFFFRQGGTMDFILVEDNYTEVCSYTIENGNLTVNSASGTFTGSATADGVYCNELYTTFVLGDTSIAADGDYIYIYKEELGGYEVTAIDKTKAEYGAIKTGINGIDTVKLADYMFYADTDAIGNNLLTIPKIPSSVSSISDSVFRKCTSLISVIIPDSITSIDACAFLDCSSLTSVIIPDSVTSIGSSAFRSCDNLSSIKFEGTMEQWNAINKYSDGLFDWNSFTPATHVQCSDGTVPLK